MSYYRHSPQRKMKNVRRFLPQNLEYIDEETQVEDFPILFDVETQTEEIPFNPFIEIDPQQAAFACLIEGIGFSQFQRLCLFLNKDPPPRNQFFEAQDKICKDLLNYARSNCSNYLSQVEQDEAICFDGSWSQKRHAKHCFGAFWASKLRKFIDFDTMSLIENPNLTSNSLESEILKVLARRHMDDQRFKYFVHDKDTKSYTLIHDVIGWKLEERLDFTHTTKAWKRMFEKMKMLAINGNKNRSNVLGSLENSLIKWFHVSIKLDCKFEQRKSNYLLALSHCMQKESWKYRNNQSCVDQLKKFLEDSSCYLEGVNVNENTQMNESLHSVKGRCAPKITFWKSSWDARTAATILHFNEGPKWYLACYHDLIETPLHPLAETQLKALAENKAKFYEIRNQIEYKRQEQLQRIEKRANYKTTKKTKKSEFDH